MIGAGIDTQFDSAATIVANIANHSSATIFFKCLRPKP